MSVRQVRILSVVDNCPGENANDGMSGIQHTYLSRGQPEKALTSTRSVHAWSGNIGNNKDNMNNI